MKSARAEGLIALRAAIYARKSTDDSDRHDDNKSTTRQVDRARDYAKKRGWTIDDEHVYKDDGISGAEFKNRPDLLRMLNSLKQFDVIIMSELSRIGRDQIQTAQCLSNIEAAGVAVELYLTNERLRFETAVDRFITNAVSFAAELEREKAGQRSRDALERKARAGFNAGGVVYGYDNVPQFVGEKKSHTAYRINEGQAEVLRGIFKMYADGYGQKVIAYCLNGNPKQRDLLKWYFGGKQPTPPRKGKSWSLNTIHDMLRNPRYEGRIPYGGTRRKYIGGTKKIVRSVEQLFEAPQLRIIDEKLAAEVKQRLDQMAKLYLRSTNGQLHGRPESGQASRYLLSGLVRCAECDSAMVVSSSFRGSGKTRRKVRLYVCSGRHTRGPTVCSNWMRPLLQILDDEVLKAIDHHISPAALRASARRAVEMIQAENRAAPDKAKRLREDLKRAEAKVESYVAAIGAGGKLESLVSALAKAEAERDALRRQVAEIDSPPVLEALTGKALEKRLTERAAYWRDVLTGDPVLARQGLKALLAGPITFAPDREGFRLKGSTKIGALWAPDLGIKKSASPRGFEPRLPP